jgi:hypothetical protein
MIKHVAPVAVAAWERNREATLNTELRRVRAEGKLAAIIQWAGEKKEGGVAISADDVLARIEAMFENDAAKRPYV